MSEVINTCGPSAQKHARVAIGDCTADGLLTVRTPRQALLAVAFLEFDDPLLESDAEGNQNRRKKARRLVGKSNAAASAN
jgi:hypothetical protein